MWKKLKFRWILSIHIGLLIWCVDVIYPVKQCLLFYWNRYFCIIFILFLTLCFFLCKLATIFFYLSPMISMNGNFSYMSVTCLLHFLIFCIKYSIYIHFLLHYTLCVSSCFSVSFLSLRYYYQIVEIFLLLPIFLYILFCMLLCFNLFFIIYSTYKDLM